MCNHGPPIRIALKWKNLMGGWWSGFHLLAEKGHSMPMISYYLLRSDQELVKGYTHMKLSNAWVSHLMRSNMVCYISCQIFYTSPDCSILNSGGIGPVCTWLSPCPMIAPIFWFKFAARRIGCNFQHFCKQQWLGSWLLFWYLVFCSKHWRTAIS